MKEKNKFRLFAIVAVILAAVVSIDTLIDIRKEKTPGLQPTAYTFTALDNGLREVSVFAADKGKDIEIRDLRPCRTDEKANCQMTRIELDSRGRFKNRESYEFNHGLKQGMGELVQIAKEDKQEKVSAWGIGNQIPYVLKAYADKPGDRRIFHEQQQADLLLAEMK